MNYQKNGKNDKSAQMKTVYITLALALAFISLLIIMTGAWRRSTDRMNAEKTAEVIVTVPNIPVIATGEDTTKVTTEAIIVTETESTTEETPAAIETFPGFITPVSGYLMNPHSGDTPVFSITMNDYRPHIGVDLYGAVGDDVFAAASGTITEIWEDPMAGNCISIAHSGGAVTVYRNLSPLNPDGITVGSEVTAGEVIGSIGDTSLLEIAEDPHLHFELSIEGRTVDPSEYISFPVADTEYEG